MSWRVLLPLLGLIPCARAASPDSRLELLRSHECLSCHRLGERGGGSGPDLTLVGLRRPRAWIDAWLKDPAAWKRDTLMPRQGLADSDREALADYLTEQKGQAWGTGRPWSGLGGAEAGRSIYERAGCVACHGAEGRGGHPNPGARGGVIPALAALMGTYKKEELVARVRAGVTPETGGAPAAVSMPAWAGVLSDLELSELADYLLSLAPKGEEAF